MFKKKSIIGTEETVKALEQAGYKVTKKKKIGKKEGELQIEVEYEVADKIPGPVPQSSSADEVELEGVPEAVLRRYTLSGFKIITMRREGGGKVSAILRKG